MRYYNFTLFNYILGKEQSAKENPKCRPTTIAISKRTLGLYKISRLVLG